MADTSTCRHSVPESLCDAATDAGFPRVTYPRHLTRWPEATSGVEKLPKFDTFVRKKW